MRDAVDVAETYLRDHARQDRRVLLVVTDGIDNASTATADVVQRHAERTATVIDALGLFHNQDDGRAHTGRHELKELTERTGGIAYFPDSVEQIETAAVDVARQIRSQYTIAYAPANQALDGSYRSIRVTVDGPDRYTIRTRPGYRAVAEPVSRERR
jgi:VWFA-related protein